MAQSLPFDFQRDVVERSFELPVLVDFWAEWCAPCRMLAPVLERLAEKHAGRWTLVKINTEEHPDVASGFQVRGIPAVMLFSGGKVVDSFTGALSEPQVEEWLRKAVPGPRAKDLLLAEGFMRDGEYSKALPLLEEVCGDEPDNLRALSLLSRLKLFSDPGAVLPMADRLDAGVDYMEQAETLRTLGRLLAADPSAFPAGEVRAGYLEDIEKLRREDFDGALKGFIEVLKAERQYDDDGSRRACIAIFRLLGEEHGTSMANRRAFDRAF